MTSFKNCPNCGEPVGSTTGGLGCEVCRNREKLTPPVPISVVNHPRRVSRPAWMTLDFINREQLVLVGLCIILWGPLVIFFQWLQGIAVSSAGNILSVLGFLIVKLCLILFMLTTRITWLKKVAIFLVVFRSLMHILAANEIDSAITRTEYHGMPSTFLIFQLVLNCWLLYVLVREVIRLSRARKSGDMWG